MRIQNMEELSNILSRAFQAYSTQIGNGVGVESYIDFMEGFSSIEATITLKSNGEITVKPVAQSLVVQPLVAPEAFVVEEAPIVEIVTEEPVVLENKPKRKTRA